MLQKTIFSFDEYQLMIGAGVFDRHVGQIELIRGELCSMNPAGPEHSDIIDWLNRWSVTSTVDNAFIIRVQSQIDIRHLQSMPEPDIAWLRVGNYRRAHPRADDVALLIEVAFSSVSFDRREKAELYAEAGIADYWLVDVAKQSVEIRRQPKGIVFQDIQVAAGSDVIFPLCRPSAGLQISQLFPATT